MILTGVLPQNDFFLFIAPDLLKEIVLAISFFHSELDNPRRASQKKEGIQSKCYAGGV